MFLVNSSVGSLAAARSRFARLGCQRISVSTERKVPNCKNIFLRRRSGALAQVLPPQKKFLQFLNTFLRDITLWQISQNASGQSLFRSYGRFFAEFLSEGSLVGLRLLASSTGVGLRYGRQKLKLTSFSGQSLPQNRLPEGSLSLNSSSLKSWTDIYHESALRCSP